MTQANRNWSKARLRWIARLAAALASLACACVSPLRAQPLAPTFEYPLVAETVATPSEPVPVAVEPHAAAGPMPALLPAAPYPIRGVDCLNGNCGMPTWESARPLDWQPFGQGEYVGHPRWAHVPEYRLRVDDRLEFLFRVTRNEQSTPYELNVGDEIRVESFIDDTLNRDLIIQPDGTITLRLLGQVHAARMTVNELRDEIEQLYSQYYRSPTITVTPLRVNTKLEDLRATFDNRAGLTGGQSRQARVTPEGTVALPAIGSVPAQGLTLDELKREIEARYGEVVDGIEITPVLLERAPRYVYVLGEVRTPGRYTLEGPTTAMQAVALAGGWIPGGNLRQMVIFRRGDDWRLVATKLDLRGSMLGKIPCPADELWVNDSDIVLVPKMPIRVADDALGLFFTEGLYRIVPFTQSVSFGFTSALR